MPGPAGDGGLGQVDVRLGSLGAQLDALDGVEEVEGHVMRRNRLGGLHHRRRQRHGRHRGQPHAGHQIFKLIGVLIQQIAAFDQVLLRGVLQELALKHHPHSAQLLAGLAGGAQQSQLRQGERPQTPGLLRELHFQLGASRVSLHHLCHPLQHENVHLEVQLQQLHKGRPVFQVQRVWRPQHLHAHCQVVLNDGPAVEARHLLHRLPQGLSGAALSAGFEGGDAAAPKAVDHGHVLDLVICCTGMGRTHAEHLS
mmetsp:Transcript_2810/g.6726  ORF Transcript_2810/g.6726 Transcript_2810/m.6726 type:complete len:254 (-) Transcript_2810:897-1658(-)